MMGILAVLIVLLVAGLAGLAYYVNERTLKTIELIKDVEEKLDDQIDGVRKINDLNSKSLTELVGRIDKVPVSEDEFLKHKTYTCGNVKNLWIHVHDLDRIIGLEPERFHANEIED